MKLAIAAALLLLLGLLFQPLQVAALRSSDGAHGRVLYDEGNRDSDLIDELPNQPESSSDFRQYGGYVVVNPTTNKRYFYYFVEAVGDSPTTKPLILYMGCHGGSWRCSPLLSSFLQVGPFKVESDGQTLDPNPYSWNQFANIIFVEGPVGIGFSLSDSNLDRLQADDNMVVREMYEFMVRWLLRFPEYKGADFYIAGQEYIGVIAPSLANFIVQRNARLQHPAINLKGILMGNPMLDESIETYLGMEYGYRNNIITEETLTRYENDCTGDVLGANGSQNSSNALRCMASHGVMNDLKYMMDPYSTYGKLCSEVDLDAVTIDTFRTMVYECEIQNVAGYLNIPFVQRVMHVENPAGGPAIWNPYATETEWDRSFSSSEDDIKAILADKIRVLIYGGVLDHDEPVLSSEFFVSNLNLTVLSDWRPWFDNSIQVAGYTETYQEGLTFATVRNAGRKVSEDQPKRGYILAKSFLTNNHLPKSAFF